MCNSLRTQSSVLFRCIMQFSQSSFNKMPLIRDANSRVPVHFLHLSRSNHVIHLRRRWDGRTVYGRVDRREGLSLLVHSAAELPDFIDGEATSAILILPFREDDEISISAGVKRPLDALQPQHLCRCRSDSFQDGGDASPGPLQEVVGALNQSDGANSLLSAHCSCSGRLQYSHLPAMLSVPSSVSTKPFLMM